MFNQRILLSLISSGVMSKEKAVEMAADLANSIREINTDDRVTAFVEQLARSYEQVAVAISKTGRS